MVSKLSLTTIGTQCSAGSAPPRARARSIASASIKAFGFTWVIAFSAGPCLSYASIRFRYCSTRPRQVSRLARIAAWIWAMVASSIWKGAWAPSPPASDMKEMKVLKNMKKINPGF